MDPLDIIVFIAAVIVVGVVPFDLYVMGELVGAAREDPPIDALTGGAVVSVGISAGALLAAVVAINGVVFLSSDPHAGFLPTGVGTLLLALSLPLFSFGNVYMLILLRRWAREAREAREAGQHRLRRQDDPPA
jgi:hypothetical protein